MKSPSARETAEPTGEGPKRAEAPRRRDDMSDQTERELADAMKDLADAIREYARIKRQGIVLAEEIEQRRGGYMP